ncbi:hypothetical protein JHK85_000422 [Glycine max]|nr:hypothetical protein JHK85_000422 [Glycine max]KAG5087805.1 hypothetical protein JHK86_000417 [Glycine max]
MLLPLPLLLPPPLPIVGTSSNMPSSMFSSKPLPLPVTPLTVFYLEACEFGSIFEGLIPEDINIYATTTSNAEESSWGTYCPGEYPSPPLEYSTCLGLSSDVLFHYLGIDPVNDNFTFVNKNSLWSPSKPVNQCDADLIHFWDKAYLNSNGSKWHSNPINKSRGEFAEGGGDKRSGVEEESIVGGEGAGGEDVEEGGFSGAAGAHRGQDFGGEGGEGDVFKDAADWWGGGAWGEEERSKLGFGGGFGVGDLGGA